MYKEYETECYIVENVSGHDLGITLALEDTIIQYHFANGEHASFITTRLFEGAPGYDPIHQTWDYPPYSIVERTATFTFDGTYSHVSKVTYYYDSIGELERGFITPKDWNFFDLNSSGFHDNHIQNDTFFHVWSVTPAYYDHAVEQSRMD
jgi:hypothetical protein